MPLSFTLYCKYRTLVRVVIAQATTIKGLRMYTARICHSWSGESVRFTHYFWNGLIGLHTLSFMHLRNAKTLGSVPMMNIWCDLTINLCGNDALRNQEAKLLHIVSKKTQINHYYPNRATNTSCIMMWKLTVDLTILSSLTFLFLCLIDSFVPKRSATELPGGALDDA